MNTTQIKRFAQEARKKLITLVGGKLEAVLTQDSAFLRTKADIINKLNSEIKSVGKDALIDRVAYTWFNRLVALRFMDANDFQPLGINILSPAQGVSLTSPQILNDIQAGIFPENLPLDRTYINNVLSGITASSNPDNDIYRHVLIAVCNDLHRIFPFLFERIDDYTELLLPDDLTSPFSIVADVVNGMSADDCKEVEIIGWLYQFYISEKKDEVFASKNKVKKEDIPAATQLFTPRWIVEYMVQNTVGKLWLQNNPNSNLKEHMPYYIESPDGETSDYLKINSVEEIKLLDQACGSGHILVYGFELFAKIYEEQGYAASDIPSLIIENNLYGLEIDERAAQLAAFAITMKARQYYRRFYRKVATPCIICFEDITLSADEVSTIIDQYNITAKDAFKADLKLLEQATNFGSLIQPKTDEYTLTRLLQIMDDEGESSDLFWQQTQIKLRKALVQLIALAKKYHCVVDNPPYMGGGKMNVPLSDFVKNNYPKSKADLMACFMEVGISVLYPQGYLGMINQQSWMFLDYYKLLRKEILEKIKIENLVLLGSGAFEEIDGEIVKNVSFVFSNTVPNEGHEFIGYKLDYINDSEEKEIGFFKTTPYTSNQYRFNKIPDSPIGFWFSDKRLNFFDTEVPLSEYADVRAGLQTGDNEQFLRVWNEVNVRDFCMDKFDNAYKWFTYNKGGEFRKWFGNKELIINWMNNGEDVKNDKLNKLEKGLIFASNAKPKNTKYYFKNGITWTTTGGKSPSFRIISDKEMFDIKGSSLFPLKIAESEDLLGLLNTKIVEEFLRVLSPNLDSNPGYVAKIPINISPSSDTKSKVNNCLLVSMKEWHSRETSWGFQQSELLRLKGVDIQNAVNSYKEFWATQFHTLHQNEEELNRQFIDIYGLQDELTPDVPLKDITILRDEAKIEDDQLVFQEDELIAQFVSYAVGCIFGRYSLDKEGLILANQGETFADFLSKVEKAKEELLFIPDEDNVIPVLEEEWFDDDIVTRIKAFVRTVWGEESYNDNIHYIEDALGKDLRKYIIKDFYKDHIKRYKKRPIYWLFSSPKGHFKVLIYMHRYTPDTLNFILNSYLRPFMEKIKNDLKRQEDIIITGSATEQGNSRKRQDKLKDMLIDCEAYEYDILFPLAGERIAIDLDDGVLVNYNKFGNAIASVPGLNDAKTKKKVKAFDWIDTTTIK